MQLLKNNVVEYNYDATLHNFETYIPKQTIEFHCYWNGIFNNKQLLSIISLFATQKRYSYNLNIWLSRDTIIDKVTNEIFQNLLHKYRDNINIRYVTISEITQNTPFYNNNLNYSSYANISDIIRFSLLYKYGGLWFDIDCCFLKDIRDLFKVDFVYNWEFQNYANSALFYISKAKNDNIVELSNIATKIGCRPWEIFALDAQHMKKIGVYPCWMFDPRWSKCTINDIFEKHNNIFEQHNDFIFFFKRQNIIQSYDQFYPNAYVYHWHNCWEEEIEIEVDSCADMLFSKYKKDLKI